MKKMMKFDSVGKFLHYLNTTPTSGVFVCANLASQKLGDKSFRGTESYEEADNLFRHGDRELFARLRTAEIKRAKGTGIATKNQYNTSVCGFVPHVPNYVQGLPNNMINKRVVRYQSSKVVNIVYNPSVHAVITTDEMIQAALNIINFVIGLESKGYRCNIYILMSSYTNKDSVTAMVRIKTSDDYMDKLKLVYPMVNPSMLRRHFLRFVETAGCKEKKFTAGYGAPVMDIQQTRDIIIKEYNIKADYVFTFESAVNGINITV